MSHSTCQYCLSRRQFLQTGLALGTSLLLPNLSHAGGFAQSLQGETWVNGRIAHDKTRINANSFIKTTTHSASFVIGDNAFTLRPNSQVRFTPVSQQSRSVITSLRLLTGGLLSVFGKGSKQLFTPAATIGIRGTGVYMESNADSSYVCLCYGKVDLTANIKAAPTNLLEATHHQAKRIQNTGSVGDETMLNHTDDELVYLESLVGRKVPFA